MELELNDKTVLIVGGASGIGATCGDRFRREGARVFVWDRMQPTQGRESLEAYPCDISHADSVQRALDWLVARSPTLDCLVHTAAVGSGHYGFPFHRVPLESWRHVMEVNVLGMAAVAYAIAPVMIRQQAGSMVFLSSVAGQIGSQTDPPYSAAKAANLNFAICLARDLAGHQIRVNSVCPGMVQTPLNRSVWQAWHDAAPPAERIDYESWTAEKFAAWYPGRWQSSDDVADAILFLSSCRAAQITGQTLNVDGGFVMPAACPIGSNAPAACDSWPRAKRSGRVVRYHQQAPLLAELLPGAVDGPEWHCAHPGSPSAHRPAGPRADAIPPWPQPAAAFSGTHPVGQLVGPLRQAYPFQQGHGPLSGTRSTITHHYVTHCIQVRQ